MLEKYVIVSGIAYIVHGLDGKVCSLRHLYANNIEIDLRESSAQLFLMQYGLVQFQAEIVDETGAGQTLWSKYCSALNSADSGNIRQMIQRIAEIEDPVKSMLCWPSRSPRDDAAHQAEDDERYSMLSGFTMYESSDQKRTSSVVQDIIEVYQKMLDTSGQNRSIRFTRNPRRHRIIA